MSRKKKLLSKLLIIHFFNMYNDSIQELFSNGEYFCIIDVNFL